MWDSYSVWKLCQCCTAWLLLIVLHDNTDVLMWYYRSLPHYHSWEAPFTTGGNMSRTLDTSRPRPLSDTTEHFEDRALLFVIYRPNSFELSRLHQIREIKENLDTCHQSYGTLLLLCCHTLFSYSSSVQETDFMSRVNLGYWNFGHWKWATGNFGQWELEPLGTWATCHIATVPNVYLFPNAANPSGPVSLKKENHPRATTSHCRIATVPSVYDMWPKF